MAGRGAFTLVEILVVVAIMVILAGAGTVAAMNYLSAARDKETKLRMSQVAQACESYKLLHDGEWPASLAELVQPSDGSLPLLKGGQTAIATSDGKAFSFKRVTDNTGTERMVILSTDGSGREISYPDR